MRKPGKVISKPHPTEHRPVAVKAPEKAEKPEHIKVMTKAEAIAITEKSNVNKHLIDGLKRAKQQIWQFHFRNDEAVQATKWIDELIAKAEG